jgi:hypothetical protein
VGTRSQSLRVYGERKRCERIRAIVWVFVALVLQGPRISDAEVAHIPLAGPMPRTGVGRANIATIYPIPASGPLSFIVVLPEEGRIRIRVFDVRGHTIATVVDSYELPGAIGFLSRGCLSAVRANRQIPDFELGYVWGAKKRIANSRVRGDVRGPGGECCWGFVCLRSRASCGPLGNPSACALAVPGLP